jgi:phosphoribosyl 1,2-cyclic phosphodiesterase
MPYTLTIWGARGSIPTPGAHTTRYGGNTPCVSVERSDPDDHRVVILDAGTGIRLLGNELLGRGGGSVEADLLITHTHWDHIQGLPFFGPFFQEGNTVRVWGSKQGDVELGVILRQQMHPVVFPVPLDRLAAELRVEHVDPGEFEIDGFAVRSLRLRHPGNTLGYRLCPVGGGASVAYVTDNELGPGGDYDVGQQWRRELREFLGGVDVLIHDAMYTTDEIGRHRGWGHSSHTEAVALAAEAEVKRLVLFHHRPEHDDAAMDQFVEAAVAEGERSGHAFEVLAATEGMQLTL